jgi:nicotinamidase-related amidase
MAHERRPRGLAAATALAGCMLGTSLDAATIIDEWASAKAPEAPPVKPVTVDRKTTALLLLDFNQQTCNPTRRPRCVASIPKVRTFRDAARGAGVPVFYSVGGGGNASDIPPELAPAPNEPVVSSGVDKFRNTDLEKLLKDRGIETVIVIGTAAHGAVLYTASGAAMRGMKVILPLDGISGDTTYIEQYTAWHLVNVPVISPQMTLTTIDGVKF